MIRCSIVITVVLIHQLMSRQVFGDISDENWFVNGSQTCKTYRNQTNLATDAALYSTLHFNTTIYYMTNVSDWTQNLHLFMPMGRNEETEKNLLLDLKLDFKNDFIKT